VRITVKLFTFVPTIAKITIMNKIKWLNLEKIYLIELPNFIRPTTFILFLSLSTQMYAQQQITPRNFSIQAGINGGLLSGGFGPSFSFHYALRTEKVLQLESMIFLDSHSGKKAISGHTEKSFGYGLAAGIRINVLPQKNWNPSFAIMPAIMYSSETTSRYDDKGRSGISGAICLAISNTFNKRHMVSIGLNQGENISAGYLKYGFWF